ncbi:eukaryotic translation initiation factor 2-alpha kinase, partial [Bonamia ostreae]
TSKTRYERDFDQIAELGAGAYGVVYKVRNKLDGMYYAIKQIVINDRHKMKMLEKLLSEVKAIARLSHVNVVRYYQAWIEDVDPIDFSLGDSYDSSQEMLDKLGVECYDSNLEDYGSDWEIGREMIKNREEEKEGDKVTVLFIQMEYCEGDTLKNLIDSEKPIPKELIWKLFVQIFEVVDFIHSKKTIHRDLKTTNIFL